MDHSSGIYLDYAAATPLDPAVRAAMEPYFSGRFYNPSALYLGAKAVARDVAEARARVAKWLGARPGEIVFTAGGTEANNLAIHGIMQQYPDGNLVVSAVEHEAVLKPADGYDHQIAPVRTDGQLDLEAVHSQINDQTVLISVMYANNEIGTLQPIRKLSQLLDGVKQARKKRGNPRPLYLHTDACQASLYLDLHTARLGVDLMTLNGGKMYGPKQSGVLYVRAGMMLRPQILGGGQENSVRSGTENVPGIMGFAAALDQAQAQRHDEAARLRQLQQYFFRQLATELLQATINGSQKHRLPNNVHITIPGQDNERLVMALDEQGIQCAAGSACSASNEEPSHVLQAIGLSESEAQASLRFTMGRSTDEAAIDQTVTALKRLVA